MSFISRYKALFTKREITDLHEFAQKDSDARDFVAIISGFGGTLIAGIISFNLASGVYPAFFHGEPSRAEKSGALVALFAFIGIRALLPLAKISRSRVLVEVLATAAAVVFAFVLGWFLLTPVVFLLLLAAIGDAVFLAVRPKLPPSPARTARSTVGQPPHPSATPAAPTRAPDGTSQDQ